MDAAIYFYLEPYVYLSSGENGVILVNLLDDKTFVFHDSKSIDIATDLMSSPKGTVCISKQDADCPLISTAIRNYMGDLISSINQPLQFASEVNHKHGVEAYLKSIIYSKYNVGANIINSTIFTSLNHIDTIQYINSTTGTNSSIDTFCNECEKTMEASEVCAYAKQLIDLNPNMQIRICGVSLDVLDLLIDTVPIKSLNVVLSHSTINDNPQLYNYILNNGIYYTILLDLSSEIYELPAKKEQYSIMATVSNVDELTSYFKLIETGYSAQLCLVLNPDNIDFIKSMISVTEDELINLPHKYQVIKANNLVNCNLWGNIYIMPDGNVHFSLINNRNHVKVDSLYVGYKEVLFNGSIDWILNRNFPKCQKCIYNSLCPSPNYLEFLLRDKKNRKLSYRK